LAADAQKEARTVVQVVQTRWTKQSRGMPGARVRNAVPEALDLPEPLAVGPEAQFVVHEVVFDERDAFVPRETVRALSKLSRSVNALSVEHVDGLVILSFPDGRRLSLAPGEYGRVVFNLFSDEARDHGGLRIYEKFAVNASNAASPVTTTFTSRQPDKQIRALQDLR